MPEQPEDPSSVPAKLPAERVEVRRAGGGPVGSAGSAGDPFADISQLTGGLLGSGKRAFGRTFRWAGLLAVGLAAMAGAWAGNGHTFRGVLTALLVLGPAMVIAAVLAGRQAAAALAAAARQQMGAADDPRVRPASAAGTAVLAMALWAAFVASVVRAIWR
jgi:hypothetical protein